MALTERVERDSNELTNADRAALPVSGEFSVFDRTAFALTGALGTLFVFLFAFWAGLGEDDGAKAGGALAIASDRVVLSIAVPVALVGALIAFALSFLWTQLAHPPTAALRTCQVTWAAAAIGGYAFGPIGIPTAFAALLVSSVACRFALPQRSLLSDSRVHPAR